MGSVVVSVAAVTSHLYSILLSTILNTTDKLSLSTLYSNHGQLKVLTAAPA